MVKSVQFFITFMVQIIEKKANTVNVNGLGELKIGKKMILRNLVSSCLGGDKERGQTRKKYHKIHL